jgi:hypothetical protein
MLLPRGISRPSRAGEMDDVPLPTLMPPKKTGTILLFVSDSACYQGIHANGRVCIMLMLSETVRSAMTHSISTLCAFNTSRFRSRCSRAKYE